MKRRIFKYLCSLVAITLLFSMGCVALATIREYSTFGEYVVSHTDSNTSGVNDTATGQAILLHKDNNGKYWGYARAKITISGIANNGEDTWTVNGDSGLIENKSTAYKKVTGVTPWGRSATGTLTVRCRHTTSCTNTGEIKKVLRETW